jgi:hypothetical protein
MLSVIMMNVIKLSVVMLNVVAPHADCTYLRESICLLSLPLINPLTIY